MQATTLENKKYTSVGKMCINKSFILKGPDELQNLEPAKTPNKFSLHTRGSFFYFTPLTSDTYDLMTNVYRLTTYRDYNIENKTRVPRNRQ